MLSQNPQAMPQSSTATGASTQEQHLRAQLELLQNHDSPDPASASAPSTSRESRSPLSRPPNGYEPLAQTSQELSRPLLSKLDAESHIHPDLRAATGNAPTPNMMPMAPHSGHSPGPVSAGPSATPLAPAPPPPLQGPMDDGTGSDGRKAKRELSQSKRAAQNRAAQRAFRQRKEGYIKKLEQQVRDFADLEHSYKTTQSENYALREYVIHLQSRLLDTQGEFPPPPPNVNLSQTTPPGPAPPPSVPQQAPLPGSTGVETPLEAVAQAVAGLAAQEQMAERQQSYASPSFKGGDQQQQQPSPQQHQQQSEQDTRSTEEINRQLNSEERATQA